MRVSLPAVLLPSFASARLDTIHVAAGHSCGIGYSPCSPPGAFSGHLPEIGPQFADIFVSLLDSVNSQPSDSPQIAPWGASNRAIAASSICCATGSRCLLLRGFNVSMCWDRFTTDFAFPDGSYGATDTGDYVTPAGDEASLISGVYRLANGSTGNIYSAAPTMKPDTSTLLLPTPWTSSGVGTAIPASQLASQANYTPTISWTYPSLATVMASSALATSGYGDSTLKNVTSLPAKTLTGTSFTASHHPAMTIRPTMPSPIGNGEEELAQVPTIAVVVSLGLGIFGSKILC